MPPARFFHKGVHSFSANGLDPPLQCATLGPFNRDLSRGFPQMTLDRGDAFGFNEDIDKAGMSARSPTIDFYHAHVVRSHASGL